METGSWTLEYLARLRDGKSLTASVLPIEPQEEQDERQAQ
jgi:hypothetical protein